MNSWRNTITRRRLYYPRLTDSKYNQLFAIDTDSDDSGDSEFISEYRIGKNEQHKGDGKRKPLKKRRKKIPKPAILKDKFFF